MLGPGAQLGHYKLVAEIGAGGMGQIFRAVDTRLDRSVAVKILPPHRWSDPDFRRRFRTEARAVSSLSDPNICALYDIGEVTPDSHEGTVPYLVMELLEGETLRDLLDRGRIPPRKGLGYAVQIARGLAAAHEKGLIHRDLKPENIFITRNEHVKILDFGLAKSAIASGNDSSTISHTEPGTVMGTAHYMSPEQVRGETLDQRSDIFSFGVVLYELLTGEVPFHARSPVETMNAILRDEPKELAAQAPDLPETVEAVVWRCLEKEPARRFSSARDLAFALETAAKSIGSSSRRSWIGGLATGRRAEARRSTGRHRVRVIRATVLVLILAALIAGAMIARSRMDRLSNDPPRLRALTYSGRDSAAAASPDGRLIAFVSSRDGRSGIWLKQLADGTEVAITTGPDDSAPRFAPDSSVLLFTRREGSSSAIYRVAVVGGEPRKMIDDALAGDWSPDGKSVAFIRNRAGTDRFSTLCIASLAGGEVRELAASTVEDYVTPRWSPDGRWIAVSRSPHTTSAGTILLVDPNSSERRVLGRREPHGLLSGVAWVNGGEAVVYAELAITGVSLRRGAGGAAIVLQDVDGGDTRVLLRNAHGAADTVDVVGPGQLVFTEDVTRQNLQEVSLSGEDAGRARWLTRGMSMDRQPAWTRDGRSIVFATDRSGNVDLWQLILPAGGLRRITDDEGVDWDPQAAPDGSRVFWSSNRSGHFEIWSASMDGAGARQVTRDGFDAENPSVPVSGDAVVYDATSPKHDGLWRQPLSGNVPPKLLVAGETIHPAVSADGAYVAYQRPDADGSSAIDVVRVADGSVFSLAHGLAGILSVRVQWIGATHTIAFRAADARGRVSLFAQDFEPGRDTSATRRALFPPDADVTAETFAVSPDGTRAVLSVIDEASGLMMAEGVAGVERGRQ
jgi:Tol biopolymer transport system component/tRNA A-37 threonylcarbamoyl transferase component Bud32